MVYGGLVLFVCAVIPWSFGSRFKSLQCFVWRRFVCVMIGVCLCYMFVVYISGSGEGFV